MPIRTYYSPNPGKCPLCANKFEHWHSSNESLLKECPRCGTPVLSAVGEKVNSPRIIKPSSYSDAKSAGFTIYKKTGKGEYERQ